MSAVIVIAKVGTSSLTDERGQIRRDAIQRLCDEVAEVRSDGCDVVIVTSGAIGAGLPALGFADGDRPRDARTLQAASAVGQSRLMAIYDEALGKHGVTAGQILLAPGDFFERSQYLHARGTLERLLELGVVPVINENDAVADDAIRFGDNDRIAALVAHLVGAERLVLLTDTPGLFTADPRQHDDAQLIHEVTSVTDELDAVVGGAGTSRGSGGMASKVAAARMAAYSGVTTVIAAAERENVLRDALDDVAGVGTIVRPQPRPLPAKKLWIGFALEPAGTVVVDDGARTALERDGRSLLSVGVSAVEGSFGHGACVDVADANRGVFARGLVQMGSSDVASTAGMRNADQPAGMPNEVIHRDDLVLLA